MEHAVSPVVKLREVDGFFHQPEWYRPLCFGENLYMNVTYLLPGIAINMGSKKERAAEILERIVFVLSGSVQVTHGDEVFSLSPEMVLHVPLHGDETYELRNVTEEPARFLIVMSPPPHPDLNIKSHAELRQRYLANGRIVRSGEEMKEVIGSLVAVEAAT